MENMQTQELISALVDGQLQGETFARGVELAASDLQARRSWEYYHLIGDVLRSGTLAVGSLPPDFAERLVRRLQHEQLLPPVMSGSRAVTAQSSEPAANDSSFRWKVIAGLASVAAVAVLGWGLVGGMPGKTDPAVQLAATGGATVLAPDERGVMIRDPHLDELLAAHRQLGGASALQMPAGFVRNATFDSSNR